MTNEDLLTRCGLGVVNYKPNVLAAASPRLVANGKPETASSTAELTQCAATMALIIFAARLPLSVRAALQWPAHRPGAAAMLADELIVREESVEMRTGEAAASAGLREVLREDLRE